jgi:hypothetical protein
MDLSLSEKRFYPTPVMLDNPLQKPYIETDLEQYLIFTAKL